MYSLRFEKFGLVLLIPFVEHCNAIARAWVYGSLYHDDYKKITI